MQKVDCLQLLHVVVRVEEKESDPSLAWGGQVPDIVCHQDHRVCLPQEDLGVILLLGIGGVQDEEILLDITL